MDDAAVSFGTVLDHFAESEELTSLVETLPHICSDQIALEASQERFTGERSCDSSQLNHFLSECCKLWCMKVASVVLSPPSVILDKYQEQPHLLDPYLGERHSL